MSTANVIDPAILAMACEDLACYCTAQWRPFHRAAHHDLIISKLEAVERGEIKRLIILTPPRHGKSLISSTFFPSWFLGRNPQKEIIFASYGQELADAFGRSVRDFVTSANHRAIFPNFALREDSPAAHRFATTAGGQYFAVGRGGPATGMGADVFLIDDPLKDREEANSQTTRTALHEWFKYVVCTRLTPDGAIILIQTRWHEDDLAGRLLRDNPGLWDVLSLPAIAEGDEGFRGEGEALWPEAYDVPRLNAIRAEIGSAAFESLYQQRPAAAEGAIFKRAWWRRYDERPNFVQIVQSWDTAFKSGQDNCFSVCTTWGLTANGCYYLLSMIRCRVEFPELRRLLRTQAEEWKPNAILVEDRASGQSLIQDLKSTGLPIITVKVDSDKLSRAQATTATVEAGNVYVPNKAPWLEDFMNEMACFPTGAYDDVVDSTTQALNYFRESAFEPLPFLLPRRRTFVLPTREELW